MFETFNSKELHSLSGHVLYPDSDPGGQDYLIYCVKNWEKLLLGIFISWAIIKAHV